MTRQRKYARAATRGFTLIEALVAIAMMAIILAALATVTARWMPNWNHGFARLQRSEDVALGLGRIADDLAAAEFIPASRETRKPLFEGGSRSVIFVRTAVGPNSTPALEIIRIAEIAGEQGPILVRTRARFAPGVDRMQPVFTEPVVLLRAPYRLVFSYAGADRNWHEDWRDQLQLPKAIKLTVQDAATRQTLSISTAAMLHVEVPMECINAKSLAECLSSLQPSEPNSAGKSRS